MLANGSKLYYKQKSANAFTELVDLKEIPEMGIEPEKVENTPLSASVKQYELGVGDAGDLEYKFKYRNDEATCPYRVLRGFEDSKEVITLKQELPDGTSFTFDAQVTTKVTGGALNGVIEFTLKAGLQSDITIADPA